MRMTRSLLWIDAYAGLSVGTIVLAASPWLSRLYALPLAFVVVMGLANLGYGTYSLTLARATRRSRTRLRVLIAGNALWAALCVVAAVIVAGRATWFGLATLLFEGGFVGGLAFLEWRHRNILLEASPP